MKLALSSAAASDLGVADLLDACARRGLAGVELVAGHGAWAGMSSEAAEAVRRAAAEHGVRVLGYSVDTARAALAPSVVRLARALDAPILAPAAGFDRVLVDLAAEACTAAGVRLVLMHGSSPAEAERLCSLLDDSGTAALDMGWEVRPDTDDHDATPQVLATAARRLAYVRLHGGGPEAVNQTGQGIGALMARLTLARYRGPLVLTPSRHEFRQAWTNWLRRRGGWGCGSKASDGTLVQISA